MMLAGSALLLASVLASTPAGEVKLASTWADMACSDDGEASVEPIVLQCEADIDCQPPPIAPPAVLDCNAVSSRIWIGEMIGSCDMPRLPEGPTLKAHRGPSGRSCNRFECSDPDAPTYTAGNLGSDTPPLALLSSALPLTLQESPLPFAAPAAWTSIPAPRIERPPRA